jgi:hypothetical protein
MQSLVDRNVARGAKLATARERFDTYGDLYDQCFLHHQRRVMARGE